MKRKRRNHQTRLTMALSAGDPAEIRGAVADLYETDLDDLTCEVLALLWRKRQKDQPEGVGQDGLSASIWVKTRLSERNKMPCGPHVPADEYATFNELHCFFLSVQETVEQLARLRNEHLKPDDEIEPARSQISAAVEVIQPIDRVAQRVTNWEDQ